MSFGALHQDYPLNISIISEGDTGLVYFPEQKRYYPIKIQCGIPVKLWKFTINPQGAIGHWYGSKFVIRGNNLHLFNPPILIDRLAEKMTTAENVRDNRQLLDVATNQKFSKDEIERLKESDLDPEELIGQIIKASDTFGIKPHYSQQKYIFKKQAKHMPIIFVYQPSMRHLVLMNYSLSPEKIGYLRIDTLSQLLTLANVKYGSKILVLDNFGGFIIGAALERMGGLGILVELFTTEIVHPRRILSSFTHLSLQHWDCLSGFPLINLSALLGSEQDAQIGVSYGNATFLQSNKTQDCDSKEVDLSAFVQSKITQPEQTSYYSIARDHLLEGGFDAFILATKHNPNPIIDLCLPFLSPSRPLLVYSAFPDVISECVEYFYRSSSVKLTEFSTNWLRTYQPLESRLHPDITSSTCRTGYILHGVRVKTYENLPAQMKYSIPCNSGTQSSEIKRIKLVSEC